MACRPESSDGHQWGSGPFRAIGPFSWSKGDVDHDQNDVHFWWELRRDQGWRPIGPPRFLRDAGRLACVAQVPQSGVSHLWSSCLQLHHEVWPHPWRLPIQNRQNPQLFQLHTALESGNEKVARHAGREANRHRVRHGAHDANGLQALRDWWGHPLARLDLEPPDDQRLWYEIRRILLHQPCLRQPQESLSRGPETGEGRVWPQWHPPQPHGHADGECSAEFRGHQRAHRVWQAAPLFQTWRHPGGEKHRHPGGWAGIRFSAGARLHHCKDGRHDEHWCMWISASWTERTRWWKLESRPGPSWIWVAIQGHLLQPDPRLPSGALRPPDMRIPRHLKCPRCFRQMEPVTDANIATEVARREAMAHTRGVPFSMDKVIFNHPRRGRVARQPEKGSSSSSTAVRTRSTYGNLRDMARNYVRSFKKRGFKDLVDRLVRDPFFQFNAANQNLVPEALLFIERLAGCVSPTIERTKAQVLGEKLEMATKLIFVPSSEREPDQPLDLHTEVFVSHRGVFLDIGQFAVYVAKFIKPKQRPLPIVYGWGNRDFVPDAADAKEIAKELVEFSKLQWSNYASQQTHKESDTTGDDREVSLPHASGPISRPEHERPHHEQFEPNLGKPARGGPYGQGQGGKGHYKGGGQTKGKGQQKGKGKQGRSPPGGVAYGDFEGDSYWVQGYRYTWYWNQQRGWYWRWTWTSGWLALTPRSCLSFQICLPGGMPVYDKLGRHRTHWTHQSFDAHYASHHSNELQCIGLRTVWMN